jgi:hypothetical protein
MERKGRKHVAQGEASIKAIELFLKNKSKQFNVHSNIRFV